MTRFRAVAALLAVLLAAGACGDDDDDRVASDGTTSTTSTTTTTTDDPPGGPLPGERVEIFPSEGADLLVVGVEAGDVLNVRRGPGVDFDVVVELEPLAEGLVATGHNRSLDGAMWNELTVDGRTGWANSSFLLQPGAVDDVTSRMWPDPADRPRAATMPELGLLVADRSASEDPPSRVVVVDGPRVDDLGEITVDVIGFGDDAVGGERLKVFAERDEAGDGFVVRTVEATTLCSRDVTDDGLCV